MTTSAGLRASNRVSTEDSTAPADMWRCAPVPSGGMNATEQPVGKAVISPAMPRPVGDFRCPLCDGRYERAGNCASDDIPLRRMGPAKI